MRFTNLSIDVSDQYVELACMIDDKRYFYQVDIKYKDYVTKTYDPFFVALIPTAVKFGFDMSFDGPLSQRLYYNVTKKIIPYIKLHFKSEFNIKISCKGYTNVDYHPKEVATGMSCGVDSLCNVEDHFFNQKCIPDYKLTALVNFKSEEVKHGIFLKRVELARKYADRIGLPLIVMDSNIFEGGFLNHQRVHPFSNCSFPLVMQKFFKKFSYSSSFHFKFSKGPCDPFMTTMEPVLVPLMSTESTETLTHGHEYTRVEKTEMIAKNPINVDHLFVCTSQVFLNKQKEHLNCGKCDKCVRTILTLKMLKQPVENFKNIFNLEQFKCSIDEYMRALCTDIEYPTNREIIEYALLHKYKPIVQELDKLGQDYRDIDNLQIVQNVIQTEKNKYRRKTQRMNMGRKKADETLKKIKLERKQEEDRKRLIQKKLEREKREKKKNKRYY